MEPQQQQQGKRGRSLPKFGEWDVNNPASADGFTVIFAKARDEKKAKAIARPPPPPPPPPSDFGSPQFAGKKKWLCCFPVGSTVSKQQSLEHF